MRTSATLTGSTCDSNGAKDQVASSKKDNINQGEAPSTAMAFSHHSTEKLARALSFDATVPNAIVPFALATESAAFCLWSRTIELLNLRPNQVVQNEKDEHQVSHHEAPLRECKNVRGDAEAQAREARSRDYEPAANMKKHCAKWVPTHEQAIERRLQDDDHVFPHVDENGNTSPKVSVPK